MLRTAGWNSNSCSRIPLCHPGSAKLWQFIWSLLDDFPGSKLAFAIAPSLSLGIKAPFRCTENGETSSFSRLRQEHIKPKAKSMQCVALNLSRYVMKSGVANLVQPCSCGAAIKAKERFKMQRDTPREPASADSILQTPNASCGPT